MKRERGGGGGMLFSFLILKVVNFRFYDLQRFICFCYICLVLLDLDVLLSHSLFIFCLEFPVQF